MDNERIISDLEQVVHGLEHTSDRTTESSTNFYDVQKFKVILDRIKEYKIPITGLEIKNNDEKYDTRLYEHYLETDENLAHSKWYVDAFNEVQTSTGNWTFALLY